MILLRLAEWAFVVLLIVLFVTQLIVPWLNSEQAFPLFRRRRVLEGKLMELHTKKHDRALEEEIQRESDDGPTGGVA